MRMQVISYDVWGNWRDGYEVNQAFNTGHFIDVEENTSDRAINRRLGVRGIVWEGERDYALYGTHKRSGKPALELQPEQSAN